MLKIQNIMEIKEVLLPWFINFFDKKSASLADKFDTGSGNKNEIKQNKKLAKELDKPIIKKNKKRKVHSFFRDNIWGAGLVNMQSISKFIKGIRFLL